MPIRAATEDMLSELLSGSKIMGIQLKVLTLTKQLISSALLRQENIGHSELLKELVALKLNRSLLVDPWQSVLMPPIGIFTRVESLTIAKRISITLCLWLVHPKLLGLSRTVGVLLGEKMDTSVWPRVILVQFAKAPLSPSDQLSHIS